VQPSYNGKTVQIFSLQAGSLSYRYLKVGSPEFSAKYGFRYAHILFNAGLSVISRMYSRFDEKEVSEILVFTNFGNNNMLLYCINVVYFIFVRTQQLSTECCY